MSSVGERLGNVFAWANFMVLVVVMLNTLLYLQTMTYDIQFDDQVLNKKYDAIISIYERDTQKVDYQKSARSDGESLSLVAWVELAEERLTEELAQKGCPPSDSSLPPEDQVGKLPVVIEITQEEYECDFTRAFYSGYPSPGEAEVVESYIKERPLIEKRSRATHRVDQAVVLGGLWLLLTLFNYMFWGRFRIMPWR